MEYKTTLNLPKTAFPMKAELAKREPQLLAQWQADDIYRLIRERARGKTPYVLHDGPPYANGNIHIGHALNKTLKDIIVKYKTMQGFDSPYVPGWDCHGLPVEHQLLKELGIHKSQIAQVEFRKKAHEYAMRFVGIQKEQFKRLGVFGDWEHPYLTLDPLYEEAIVRSFGELAQKDYLYRGLKPVNWCYKCETALAEAEVEYEDHVSPSVFVKFNILNPAAISKNISQGKKVFAIVWTTTPWTLIANVAIAAHPDFYYSVLTVKDELWLIQEDRAAAVMEKAGATEYSAIDKIRGKELDGISYADIFHPTRNVTHKFVLADYVSKEEGTGLVHTAPGHGQEDALTGQRYQLETVMPVDSKGKFFQDIAMEFIGEHVFSANEKIIDKLKNQGSLVFSGTIAHTYPHCWRCKTPVIFRATEQWFLKIDAHELRKRLLAVVKQEVTWVPPSGQERIAAMIELRPDWCLSRQRYWGVPIPALRCNSCAKEFLDKRVIDAFADFVAKEGSDCWFTKEVKEFLPKGLVCPHCQGMSFEKGSDILDVWFDSGVSHQAVLKKRKELHGTPCALYLEGSDQHRGWFQSSLIPSLCIDARPPFKTVLTHGHVVDGEGRKMSKSMGNVISPLDIIKDYGADIVRLWVAFSDYNEDIRISPEIITRLSEAYRKIRNTIRFMLSNLYDFNPNIDAVGDDQLKLLDAWILLRMECLRKNVTKAYDQFEFAKAYKMIYDFCNEDLSMYYLDMVKGRLYTFAAASHHRRAAQTAIFKMLTVLVRIMAPILAFTAEEAWQYVPQENNSTKKQSVHVADWPQVNSVFAQHKLSADESIQAQLATVMNLIPEVAKALEVQRSAGIIGSSFDAAIKLLTKDDFRYTNLQSLHKEDLCEIFKVSQVSIEKVLSIAQGAQSQQFPDIAIEVIAASGCKCARCWNYSASVGSSTTHPLICARCLEALGEEQTS
ncbi:MAG: isoleucine--tRNA ligase [Candidatus Omnitrophica bacterium]|nr:isoleucine--tRNA ligase [Candidatus Omnitrophota bacterium]